MIVRVLIALVGAVVITTAMLLGMNTVTEVFRESDGSKYFRISDVVIQPEPDRPERPGPVARQPDLPEDEAELPDSRLPLEAAPGFDAGQSIPADLLEPEIEVPDPASPAD